VRAGFADISGVGAQIFLESPFIGCFHQAVAVAPYSSNHRFTQGRTRKAAGSGLLVHA